MHKFAYYQPETLQEAHEIMSDLKAQAHYVAGGTDLLVRIHQKTVKPEALISLRSIKALSGIRFKDHLTISSTTLLRDIERNSQVRQIYPVLSQAIRWIGSPQIRNVATIGGNLANSAPSADCAPPLLVLDAMLTIEGPNGKKKIPIKNFFTGPGTNCLEKTEVITKIKVPPATQKSGMSFIKIGRVTRDLAISSAAVLIVAEKKRCQKIRLAVGAVSPTPVRLRSAEDMMIGEKITKKLLDQVCKEVEKEIFPISDIRSSAEYRKKVTGIIVRRAIEQAVESIK